jgi:hypothetical protein
MSGELDQWRRGAAAPAVLPYETADVLARLVFDGVLDVNDVGETWQDVAELNLELHAF